MAARMAAAGVAAAAARMLGQRHVGGAVQLLGRPCAHAPPSAPQVLVPYMNVVDQFVIQGVVLAAIVGIGQLMSKLVSLEVGLKELKEGLKELKEGLKELKEGPQGLKGGQLGLKGGQLGLEGGQLGLKGGQASLGAKLDAEVGRLRVELAQDRLRTLGVVGLGGMALYAILKPPR